VTDLLRRFGAIGDVHAEDQLLEVVLDRLSQEEVDRVLVVGDIADGRGDLDRTCALLDRPEVIAVAGNHDRWLLAGQLRELPNATPVEALSERARAYLAGLPRTVRLDTLAGPLLLCHGLGENDMAKVAPDDFGYALSSNVDLQQLQKSDLALVVNGHSHRRMVRRFGPLTMINAGTLHAADAPCFAIVDLEMMAVSFYDLDEAGVVTRSELMPIL